MVQEIGVGADGGGGRDRGRGGERGRGRGRGRGGPDLVQTQSIFEQGAADRTRPCSSKYKKEEEKPRGLFPRIVQSCQPYIICHFSEYMATFLRISP